MTQSVIGVHSIYGRHTVYLRSSVLALGIVFVLIKHLYFIQTVFGRNIIITVISFLLNEIVNAL